MAIDLTLETETIIRLPISQWKDLLQKNPASLPPKIDKRPAVFVLQA